MSSGVKRDATKQSWEGGNEEQEFPLVCETCLGDNPYVRMTVEKHGKKCQVCETPFTVFKWQAGTKGRLKRVEICRNCAQAKNVCQVCIYDLKYGLPVKVRDKVLRETGSGIAGPGGAGGPPQSIANRAWYTAQQQRMIEQGISAQSAVSDLAHAKLSEMAQMQPKYERNMAKLCSFFARGECDRGDLCPFRHEMPRDRNDPLSKQSTKDRFYGTNDPVASKILGRKRIQEKKQEQRAEQEGYDKARATLFLQIQGGTPYLTPEQFNEMTIRDAFYAYGEIVSVRVIPTRGQAFVEYTQPEACELAISSQNRKVFGDTTRTMFVAWARAPKRGEEEQDNDRNGSNSNNNKKPKVIAPLPPPVDGGKGGSGNKPNLPKVLPKVKLPPEVAAAAAAAAAAGTVTGTGQQQSKPAKLYYPSSDPNRLGTKEPPEQEQ